LLLAKDLHNNRRDYSETSRDPLRKMPKPAEEIQE